MTTCPWCGDTHRSDQLCQRAQRGITRRSFCFLFGAGIAGAMLAPSIAESYDLTNVVTRVHPDASTVLFEYRNGDAVLTFQSRDQHFRIGQRVAIDVKGQRIFDGMITERANNGHITAKSHTPGYPLSYDYTTYYDVTRDRLSDEHLR